MSGRIRCSTVLLCSIMLSGSCAASAQARDQEPEQLGIQEQLQQVVRDEKNPREKLLRQDHEQENAAQTQERQDAEPTYGSQLMTPAEREEYRTRMRAARTLEEREQLRTEHHALMKGRAMERGVILPDEPPERGWGGGFGPGPGEGMGPGGGMGWGGRNR